MTIITRPIPINDYTDVAIILEIILNYNSLSIEIKYYNTKNDLMPHYRHNSSVIDTFYILGICVGSGDSIIIKGEQIEINDFFHNYHHLRKFHFHEYEI